MKLDDMGHDVLTVFAIQPVKDVHKQLVNDIHDLAVVLIDGHLKIQPHELTEMPVGERIFCSAHKRSLRANTSQLPQQEL